MDIPHKTIGIVAEYNPFHKGHALQLGYLRELYGEETNIIAVMSGNYTQRGDAAVCSKWARAEMAARCGVDLVIELPAARSLAGAEGFARGAVALIRATGVVNAIAFGAETPDAVKLCAAAETLSSPEFIERTAALHAAGRSYPTARALASESYPGLAELLRGPNNSLALEYILAARRYWGEAPADGAPELVPTPRFGAAHDGETVGGIAPASRIRENVSGAGEYMPLEAAETLARELAAGRAPVKLADASQTVVSYLRRLTAAELRLVPDVSEGLENRLAAAIRSENSFDSIAMAAKTKRYTLARIRRALMCAYLGITSEDARLEPGYIHVLAVGANGDALLRKMRAAALPVIVRPAAGLKLTGDAARQFRTELLADDLYAMLYPSETERRAGLTLTTSPWRPGGARCGAEPR